MGWAMASLARSFLFLPPHALAATRFVLLSYNLTGACGSITWIIANRVPLSEQRINDDGTVVPSAVPIVAVAPAADAHAGEMHLYSRCAQLLFVCAIAC